MPIILFYTLNFNFYTLNFKSSPLLQCVALNTLAPSRKKFVVVVVSFVFFSDQVRHDSVVQRQKLFRNMKVKIKKNRERYCTQSERIISHVQRTGLSRRG